MVYFIAEGQTDIKKDIDNKAKLYAYTTLEHNKRPEQYIKELNLENNFDDLNQKIQPLFEGTKQ